MKSLCSDEQRDVAVANAARVDAMRDELARRLAEAGPPPRA
jgi:hypothetical protein